MTESLFVSVLIVPELINAATVLVSILFSICMLAGKEKTDRAGKTLDPCMDS